jgi:hypothetical protein
MIVCLIGLKSFKTNPNDARIAVVSSSMTAMSFFERRDRKELSWVKLKSELRNRMVTSFPVGDAPSGRNPLSAHSRKTLRVSAINYDA